MNTHPSKVPTAKNNLPTSKPRGRVSNPRRVYPAKRDALRERVKQMGRPCALCGKPIDYDAPYKLTDQRTGKKRVNPAAYVLDEIIPVSKGGSPYDMRNVQPAHAMCNARKGDKILGEDAQIPTRNLALPQPWDW